MDPQKKSLGNTAFNQNKVGSYLTPRGLKVLPWWRMTSSGFITLSAVVPTLMLMRFVLQTSWIHFHQGMLFYQTWCCHMLLMPRQEQLQWKAQLCNGKIIRSKGNPWCFSNAGGVWSLICKESKDRLTEKMFEEYLTDAFFLISLRVNNPVEKHFNNIWWNWMQSFVNTNSCPVMHFYQHSITFLGSLYWLMFNWCTKLTRHVYKLRLQQCYFSLPANSKLTYIHHFFELSVTKLRVQ